MSRRGWREKIEPGMYRQHSTTCPSTADQRPGRKCGCTYTFPVPGPLPGSSRTATHPGPLTAARAEKRRLQAAGRPAPERPAEEATLREFAVKYFQTKVMEPTTARTRYDDFRLRIDGPLGNLPLADVTRERVERWLSDLIARAPSRRMVQQTVATLRSILALAVEWERVPSNTAARLRLPAEAHDAKVAAQRVLTGEQLFALVTVGARTLRAETMLRVAGEAGLRRGEVIGLRWSDVDLEERTIHVRRSVWQERGRAHLTGGAAVKTVKGTKAGRHREVGITDDLADALARYAESMLVGHPPDGYVWPGRDGGLMSERSPAQVLERALARVGLVDEDDRPLVTFHGLRHTAASLMYAVGLPELVTAMQLGHANTHVTSTVYAHLSNPKEQRRQAAEVFNRLNRSFGRLDLPKTVERTVERPAQEAEIPLP
ncbi:MAG: hypothetical protein QOD86_2759 [Miltoncostaeaceae bacterium]|nr:hypothetical protein [Miltoncostaeaceae bacterium]